jgi:hypothetical protein
MSQKRTGEVHYPRDRPLGAMEVGGQGGLTKLQASAVLAVGLAFCLGVIYHWGFLNGFTRLTHYEWAWGELGILKTAALLFAPFAVIVWVLWRIETEKSPTYPWLLLGLLALSNFLLQALGILADPRGIQLVREIVASPKATSYFTDAMTIQRPLEWLAHFHNAVLSLHSATHPPGPVLFYYLFFKLLGPSAGALIGGCAVGLLGSVGVLVIYRFIELWTSDQRVRLTASAFYALLPALTVFFPEFDQVYPILSMLLMLFWVRAVNNAAEASKYAFYTGAVLFVATFFAYNLLLLGAFMAYYGLYWLWREKWNWPAGALFLRTSGIALGVCTGLHLVLWLASGYNPIASFRHALSTQARFASDMKRPYAIFAMLDPYDFFLGAGIIALPILVLHLQRLLKRFDAKRTDTALTLLGLGTILTVDLSGLLRGEVARVWLFLQPLVVVPVAGELSRLSWPWKLSLFALQWWILVCLKAKMSFVNP